MPRLCSGHSAAEAWRAHRHDAGSWSGLARDCSARPARPVPSLTLDRRAVVGQLPTSTPDDVGPRPPTGPGRAAGLGRATVAERVELLLAFHELLLDRRDDWSTCCSPGVGKTRLSAVRGGAARRAHRALLRPDRRRHLRTERGEGLFPLLTRIDRHYVPKGHRRRDRPVELPADDGRSPTGSPRWPPATRSC